MAIEKTHYLDRPGQPRLAYCRTPAGPAGENLPPVLFCGGYRSDMTGTKALYLEEKCRERGQAYTRFDYSAHGASEGAFEDGTIGAWRDDALAILDHVFPDQKVILAGSSMGGWIGLLLARDRPDRVAALLGIAAAPDFTQWLECDMTEEQRTALETHGFFTLPSAYGDPYIYTKNLIADGRANTVLDNPLNLTMPVRLVQGMKDDAVPWQTAHRIRNAAKDSDVEVFLIENGDHRLSQPDDLTLIDAQIRALSGL